MRTLLGALLPLLIFCNFKPVFLSTTPQLDCLPGLSENEFAFVGNGYVTLENRGFEPKKFSQIKFGFKTTVGEGLIYFTLTPKGGFESLELRNGKVIYQFPLNSDQVEMATVKPYDDGKWHVLEVRWNQEESSLVIDDSVESVAQYPEHFKGLNFRSALYFGGFKGQHNIEGITAKGFNGSIKDVQLGGTSKRLSMHTEMRNVRSGCHRRRRRQMNMGGGAETHLAASRDDFHASYNGSTNVELRWNTTTSCYDSFRIKCHKLEDGSETEVFNKVVSDYLVEIDALESNTTYIFTLIGINDEEEKELKIMPYSTLEENQPSLIVTSVTNSSLSISWNSLESFEVSFSGDSQNETIADGTNYTFENLTSGFVYSLKLVDLFNGNSTERKVATNPNPVYVEATTSDNEINLKWEDTAAVEILYRSKKSEMWKIKRLYGSGGKISELGYGCMSQLKVFAESGGRRIKSNQTIELDIDAKQVENFKCDAGALREAGSITCTWKQLPNACVIFELHASSFDKLDIDVKVNTTNNEKNEKILKGLKPGQAYSITIVSIAGNGNRTGAQATNATARTGIDEEFFKKRTATNHKITVPYYKDDRRVIDYYHVTWNDTSYILNDSSSSVYLEDLEAGRCFKFSASAVSQDVSSRKITDHICTVPYPPSSAECLNQTNTSLALTFKRPDEGHVDCYNISALEVATPRHLLSIAYGNESTVKTVITGLRPYRNYEITIKSAVKPFAQEKNMVESDEHAFIRCRTAEGLPTMINSFYNISASSSSVTLGWFPPADLNGMISYVIVINIPGDPITVDVPGDQTRQHEVTSDHFYPGRTYNFSIYAKTKAGAGPVKCCVIATLKEDPSRALFVALAILLALLFTVLIALLLFYYIRKSPQRMMSIRRMSNRLRNPTEIAMSFPQPSVTSKPVKLSQFLECMKALGKDSGLKFSEEYEDLKYVGRNQSREEAELQCNRVKNRFTNILPYDISRVKLLPMEDEDGSDYINANWIPGFHSKREFIATQGPLPSTINDFWRMVWENNCQAIVMLTQCIEKGHIKCEQYWPCDKEPVFYGDLKVEMQNETKIDEWSILEFSISLGAQSRRLKHFHYTGWPDMYVPEQKSLLAFVRVVRDSIKKSESKGPVVVHCSAGVGRTGTFVALDTLLLHIQEGHDLDVYGIVFQMRMNRVLMVQTEAQYVFIYECLSQVLEKPNGPVETIKEADTEGGVKMEDSKEEPNKKELEAKGNNYSKVEPSKKELESKSTNDSKEEQDKKELESKPDSKEDPSKKELEPNSDSNEKKSNNDSVNNPDPEAQKENAAKEEDANK